MIVVRVVRYLKSFAQTTQFPAIAFVIEKVRRGMRTEHIEEHVT